MARVFTYSLSTTVAFLLLISVGLLQYIAIFTDAAPAMNVIQDENAEHWRMVSDFTGQLLAISSTDGSVRAHGGETDGDTRLVLERVSPGGSDVKIKRNGTNTYIAVTTDGKLIAINQSAVVSESTVFTMTVNRLRRYKFSTEVQYSPVVSQSTTNTHHNSTDTRSMCHSHLMPESSPQAASPVAATCYIAIDSESTGQPPANVCDVQGNDFAFEDESSKLLFYKYRS